MLSFFSVLKTLELDIISLRRGIYKEESRNTLLTHPLKSLISCLHHYGCLCNYACLFLQYRKWDEIENRLLRRELLITENLSVQKYTQCPPDVISDPLDDCDGTPSEIADETQRQARSHQVICLAFYS
jgi:hypothetical protein